MLPFTIRQLEIFYAVAEKLSFTDASHLLHLTQPAISRQISNLENQCGKPLFEQIGKKIYLTETGKKLLCQAKKILEELGLLKTMMTEDDTKVTGTLNLCMSNGLQHIIFDVIGSFYQTFPYVNFNIFVGNSHTILNSLNKNETDFGFMGNAAINQVNITYEAINKIPIYLMSSPTNPLVNKKIINLQLLSQENFIVGENTTSCYVATKNTIKMLNLSPRNIIQIENHEAIKHAVKANLGIAFLPNCIVQLEMKEKLLIPIILKELPSYFYSVHWVQHIHKSIPPVAKIFKEFIFEKLRNKNAFT